MKDISIHIHAICDQLIEDLHSQIISDHQSVKAFSEKFDIDRHNLSRIFNGTQSMSLGLYCRILVALGVLLPGSNITNSAMSKMTLEDYFSVQSEIVLTSFVLTMSLNMAVLNEGSKS